MYRLVRGKSTFCRSSKLFGRSSQLFGRSSQLEIVQNAKYKFDILGIKLYIVG